MQSRLRSILRVLTTLAFWILALSPYWMNGFWGDDTLNSSIGGEAALRNRASASSAAVPDRWSESGLAIVAQQPTVVAVEKVGAAMDATRRIEQIAACAGQTGGGDRNTANPFDHADIIVTMGVAGQPFRVNFQDNHGFRAPSGRRFAPAGPSV